MKTRVCLLSCVCTLFFSGCATSSTAVAQSSVPVTSAATVAMAPTASAAPAVMTPLEELMAPVALYPDALIGIMLPASTNPSEVVLAARYVAGGGDKNRIDEQAWDDSVKALARYPEVLKWMDENLAWTQQVGEAYLAQPGDVMGAIQALRARARANGVLADTPQQQVVLNEAGNICIIPAQTDVLYVPSYDVSVVYLERPVYRSHPFFYFGLGYSVGDWLIYDCDWGSRVIWVGNRSYWHRRDHDWRRPVFPGHPGYRHPAPDRHQWKPRPDRPRPSHPGRWDNHPPRVERPAPHPNRPSRPDRDDRPNRPDRPRRDDTPGRPERPSDRGRAPEMGQPGRSSPHAPVVPPPAHAPRPGRKDTPAASPAPDRPAPPKAEAPRPQPTAPRPVERPRVNTDRGRNPTPAPAPAPAPRPAAQPKPEPARTRSDPPKEERVLRDGQRDRAPER